jgi:hypothetical protein
VARHNEDAIWEWVPAGDLDEDGEDLGDYVLAGSYPPEPFEAMVLALALQGDQS